MCRGCEGEARHKGKLSSRLLADRILDRQHKADRRIANGRASAFAAEEALQHLLLKARIDRTEIAEDPTLLERLQFRDCKGELGWGGTNQRESSCFELLQVALICSRPASAGDSSK